MLNPDSTLLSWITAEVSQALSVVREQMAKFGADPQNGALLQPCPGHMHQVSGALRMVGLAGATRFCEAIEAGFSGLGGALPDAATIAVLDRSVLALKEFVEAWSAASRTSRSRSTLFTRSSRRSTGGAPAARRTSSTLTSASRRRCMPLRAPCRR